MTPSERDDLIFAYSQYRESIGDFQFRLAILEGALEAILNNSRSLEEMYPYQERAIDRLHAYGPVGGGHAHTGAR